MAAPREVVALVDVYSRQVAAVRFAVINFLRTTWQQLGSWREADVDRWVASILPAVQAGRIQTAQLTVAYLAAFEQVVLGVAARPPTVRRDQLTGQALRGVDDTTLYRRVGPPVWEALSQGGRLPDAVKAGQDRLDSIAATDLQLAKTHTARDVLSRDDRVVGYRRTLEGASSCGLCIVASTRRYRRGDLLPIHPGCDCSVAPIYGDRDPGPVLDPDTLPQVHERIAERFGGAAAGARGTPGSVVDYRDVLIIHEHGEIGPILAVRGHEFTGPDQIP